MIVLDSDHLSVLLDERDSRRERLRERLEIVFDDIACTIVSLEEILRGWLAAVHRRREVRLQVTAYGRLARLFSVMGDWNILPFDEAAARQFDAFRLQRIRIGTMDLKIASIAVLYDALLLTANLVDFSQVPGLRCEDWLKP
ncbi:MAG TPA: type II toxin-antitoxin system VapC family toxin [Pirellulales bacterium]|nr:type II toxin-antitoxin system VapC family toxin [Pirellulales bacterium]